MNAVDEQMEAAIVERASEWYARHRDGGLTSAETAAFLEWLQASPLHVREYLAAATLAGRLPAAVADDEVDRQELIQRARDWLKSSTNVVAFRSPRPAPASMVWPSENTTEQNTGQNIEKNTARTAGQTFRRRMAYLTVAFIAFGLFASAAVYVSTSQPGLPGWPRSVEVPQGEQRTLRLRDGSVLHLNAGTQARVRYSRAQRLIELSHGQAMFNVAKNPERPFVVRAGATDIVAVGTQFDVLRDKSDSPVRVTVVEGQVDVLDRGRDVAFPKMPGSQPVRLVAGEQLQLGPKVVKAAPKSVDVRVATAWLRRELVFSEQPLSEVAAEFSRYGVPIEIDDRALRDYRVSGVFDAYDTESFVIYLQRLGKVERSAQGIRLSKAGAERSNR